LLGCQLLLLLMSGSCCSHIEHELLLLQERIQ
jgi:hypothetical protein